jgi:transcriptional regulator with AAA-type ATPase domain
MDPGEASRAAEIYLRNPFEATADRAAAAPVVAAAAAHAARTLDALLGQSLRREARRLAVAMAWHECADRGDSRLFDAGAVPERAFADMGLARAAVRDIATAAARCAAAVGRLAGDSAAVVGVRATTWRACFGDSVYEAIRLRPLIREQNVLVMGETGTGKELVAQAIASAAPDPARAQALNAAAIPRELLEAELFGHVKGAFTGAIVDREGRIAAADGGTLFLDEIADLPLELQAKLLRVVDDDRVMPVGADRARTVDVRYVCATSQPIVDMVERGEFRRDLYERLAGVIVSIPPLRERREDLLPIADSLFHRYADRVGADTGGSTAHLSKLTVAQARFRAWLAGDEAQTLAWKGNVRELQRVMRNFILGLKEGEPAPPPATAADAPGRPPGLARVIDAQATLREVEDWYILHVLANVQYRQRKAAEILGVDRGTLARRLRQIDAEPKDEQPLDA